MTTLRPSPPDSVLWIVKTLEEAGHETWAVGGAVRDTFARRPAGDWDLTTHARPQEVRKIFKRTVPIGIEHGTVGVLDRDGTMFEVTTFRKDVETDGRHAVVAFAESVEEDLARRDFTMNAIAWHPLRGEHLDPFGGLADLEAGILRTVGEPEERFSEDYLRILRAFRFAGRFGLDIDPLTWAAMTSFAEYLSGLSAERIREELLKVLSADPSPSVTLGLYAEAGAIAVLYPEWENIRRDRPGEWKAAMATVDRLPLGNAPLRLAALLRGVDRSAAAHLLGRLKLSNAQTDEVAHRAAADPLPGPGEDDEVFRRWLSRTGPERLGVVARLDLAGARTQVSGEAAYETVASWQRARHVRRSGVPLCTADLAVDGRDLIASGLRPGPRFGELLDQALDVVLRDPDQNTREALLSHIREWTREPTA
ncbi:MAG: hypothetical protein P8L30_11800 [Longimicrobiales bacterium]|nr:hypothetical protein [Longimicrobiales bacterium]